MIIENIRNTGYSKTIPNIVIEGLLHDSFAHYVLDAVADSKNVVITAGRIEIKFHKLFKK